METSDLTDAQWKKLHSLLPPQKPSTGRPAQDHRTVINGILWVLRTGSPWRCLPERYGSWKTVSSRFYRFGCSPRARFTRSTAAGITSPMPLHIRSVTAAS